MSGRKRIVVPCRFAYVNCFSPNSRFGDKKFSVTILISKDDSDTVEMINEAIEFTKENAINKWNGRIPNNLHLPLHDGDDEKPDMQTFKNCFYLNAKSTEAPQIVDKNVQPIEDRSELYAGCYGNVSLVFYPYNVSGNKGIGVLLGNIQKIKDGTKLTKRVMATDEFKVIAGGYS